MVVPGIWRYTLKKLQNEKNMERNSEKHKKMRNTHCRTWIMVRKLKNVENETQTLYDLEYGKTH